MKEINVKGKTKTLKKDELRLGYGRVSSYQQVRDGNGLPSQKKRCNEFAKNRGHQIEHFF